MDVKTAVLHGDLDKNPRRPYGTPEGFQVKWKDDYVCRLQKGLYGLKHAQKQWSDLAHRGGAVSGNQDCKMWWPCLSTEVEFVAATEAAKKLLWLESRQLFVDSRRTSNKSSTFGMMAALAFQGRFDGGDS
ncbi:retrovirus-related pol polyprotein from transposon TNT 1-94 [Tanacetum coccineum]|uniref:Retrovirus-related pol polyprotein from transposon TNT 1-94 n=1 Tax=Tanacetum coccineum TaxID=301880 RepID=A0ABQ5DAD9_9ASTR